MEVRAIAKNVRVSASKARLVADMVRGKRVDDALNLLKFTTTPTAKVVAKVIQSAAANAETGFQMPAADLRIVRIFVDQAPMMKRYRPASRGRASPILKRSSHITVVVAEQES